MAPGWQIYKEQMDCFDYGDALWQPIPINDTCIRRGDVGFIRSGRFYLLFSAGCPLGERRRGDDVPEKFEELEVGSPRTDYPRLPGGLLSETSREVGTGVSVTLPTTLPLTAGIDFSVELTGARGAALATKYKTYIEDSILTSPFIEYTNRHYESWVKFACLKGYGNIKPVLVSGFDKTRDFAMVAYSNEGTSLRSGLTTDIPMVASASASAWGTWRASCSPYTNYGPQECVPPPPERAIVSPSHNKPGTKKKKKKKEFPSSQPVDAGSVSTEFDQYVFVRYYTMRSKLVFIRQVVPNVMKARAGTPDLGPGENRGDAFPELTAQPDAETTTNDDEDLRGQHGSTADDPDPEPGVVVHNTSYDEEYDRWDAIADYVFQNSDAVSVLMHHQDLKGIRTAGDTDSVSALLTKHRPQIVVDASGVGRLSHQGIQRPGLEPQTSGDTIPNPESHSVATAVSDIPIEVERHVHSPDDADPSVSGPITTHKLEIRETPSPDSYSSCESSKLTDCEQDFTESESEPKPNGREQPIRRTRRSLAIDQMWGWNEKKSLSPNLSVFKTFYSLDRSSPNFADQLNNVLNGREYTRWARNLDNDGLAWLVDYLDEALDRLDPSGVSSQECLRELSSICGIRKILPTSYTLSSALLNIGRDPFAEGSCGDVYHGTLNGSRVCIKRIGARASGGVQRVTQSFCRETVNWKSLSHPNIVPLLGASIAPLQVISRWMSGGDLQEYIKKRPDADRLGLLMDVAEGLRYLHSCGLAHGNLKGQNILVDSSGRARITDIRLIPITKTIISVLSASSQRGCTLQWVAPELLDGGGCSWAADIFSFAMIMFEAFTGMVPFSERSPMETKAAIKLGERPPRPTHSTFTDNLWKLMQRCWDQKPENRPEASQVLEDLTLYANV